MSVPGLARSRSGHFLLESGYHTDTWFDLDSLFVDTSLVRNETRRLAELIKPYNVTAVCGPLLGGAFLAQALANELDLRFYFTAKSATVAQGSLFKVRYELSPSLRASIRGERVALVDDVISAGSSTRATMSELEHFGATVAVVGCLMLFGDEARSYFGSHGIEIVANSIRDFKFWESSSCPLCHAEVPLEDPSIR
jgi:orotate phosphoribosyltransferase